MAIEHGPPGEGALRVEALRITGAGTPAAQRRLAMQESSPTARIKRDELHALLETMTPAEQQPITKRTFIADIEEEIARQLAVTASSALSVEIRSKPTRERGHTVTTTTLTALKEPVAIRLERPPLIDVRYLAALVALVGLVAVCFLR